MAELDQVYGDTNGFDTSTSKFFDDTNKLKSNPTYDPSVSQLADNVTTKKNKKTPQIQQDYDVNEHYQSQESQQIKQVQQVQQVQQSPSHHSEFYEPKNQNFLKTNNIEYQHQMSQMQNIPHMQNYRENYQDYAPIQQTQQNVKNQDTSYSFWDRLIIKRPEVIKLAVFALVFLLALSIEKLISHYLVKYITDNVFTEFQEFMLRLSYPVTIFLFIWIIKSL